LSQTHPQTFVSLPYKTLEVLWATAKPVIADYLENAARQSKHLACPCNSKAFHIACLKAQLFREIWILFAIGAKQKPVRRAQNHLLETGQRWSIKIDGRGRNLGIFIEGLASLKSKGAKVQVVLYHLCRYKPIPDCQSCIDRPCIPEQHNRRGSIGMDSLHGGQGALHLSHTEGKPNNFTAGEHKRLTQLC